MKNLLIKGVETSIGSYACHRIWGFPDEDYPNSAWLADHAVALPIFPEMTDDQQSYVIKSIEEVLL